MQRLTMPAAIRRGTETAPVPEANPRTLPALAEQRRAMLSLPGWAASRAKWSGSRTYVEGIGTVPVLPEAFDPLTPDQRSWVEARIADLSSAVHPTAGAVLIPVGDDLVPMTQEQAKLVLVTEMLLAKPMPDRSEDVVAARGRAYMRALEDVSAWALDRAIGGWHAGTTRGVENKKDFTWAPDPFVLRLAALDEMAQAKTLLAELVAVRDAKKYEEIHAAKVPA